MSDDNTWKGIFVLFLFGIALGMLLCIIMVECSGSLSRPYMRGQIDAQTGNTHWSLKDNPDGTREWKHD